MTKTVLVAEDDGFLLEMYRSYFENAGYTVLTVNDGAAAVQVALEKHPDLLILDFNMPKMDGVSVVENLRKDSWGSTVKIILLSNFDPGEEKRAELTIDSKTYYLLKTETDPEKLVVKATELFS